MKNIPHGKARSAGEQENRAWFKKGRFEVTVSTAGVAALCGWEASQGAKGAISSDGTAGSPEVPASVGGSGR